MAFDRDYYQRYYFNPRTAVTSRTEADNRGRLIAAHSAYIGLPVKRILDMGCGTGMLRAPLKKALPKATYTGVEVSEYMCERFGWDNGLVQDYKSKTPFDLVICYDVVQYLDPPTARRALNNLARLCRGMMYFTALTRKDWDENCDKSRTDSKVYLRSAEWYRTILRRSFRDVGSGFWLRRGVPLTVWDLESGA
ncbi:MAG: class I SAM-dependent methyltransferase [Gammaproteobacteria bacterium]